MRLSLWILIDKSGSMHTRANMVIDGFNGFIRSQREVIVEGEEECTVSIYTFNNEVSVVREDAPLSTIEDMTAADYTPERTTALRDAMAFVLRKIPVKPLIKEDQRNVFVVLTDGEENASRDVTIEQLRALIDETSAEIVYMGSNQDAVLSGTHYGANRGASLTYDDNNLLIAIESLGNAVGRIRSGETMDIQFTEVERSSSGSSTATEIMDIFS
jgi:uncharacterized protein YegL